MKRPYFVFILVLFILISFSSLAYAKDMKEIEENLPKKGKDSYTVVVDLNEHKLYLINDFTKKIHKTYPIAGGKPSTPSPIGTWTIVDKAAGWGGGFGTRWMGMNVPWGQYGIHGTNKPLSIGGTISLGCIRMLNEDVEQLYKFVGVGTKVIIYGGAYGLDTNIFRTLIPGDRGADVYEVQRRMQDRGFYSGRLDGVYGEDMKAEVIKFRKYNKLSLTHYIDKEFYNALEIKPFE
ncbi:L,D-transpeptidase family protein [Desnuesiella massiliensis]|uniref:L,D-transpeptidase family protein n=1 Tax=Desnuesiella massiliensis TaxID=1650662 RepID=UPI0006E20A3D|nr:L,D-transpeptidase family protein [Desnuesiella massiliensis]